MAHVTQRLRASFDCAELFYVWRDDGLLDEMNRKLVKVPRLAEGRMQRVAAAPDYL